MQAPRLEWPCMILIIRFYTHFQQTKAEVGDGGNHKREKNVWTSNVISPWFCLCVHGYFVGLCSCVEVTQVWGADHCLGDVVWICVRSGSRRGLVCGDSVWVGLLCVKKFSLLPNLHSLVLCFTSQKEQKKCDCLQESPIFYEDSTS